MRVFGPIIVLLPVHLPVFVPRVALVFQDFVSEGIGGGEGRVEDLHEGLVLGNGLGKRHSVVHGAPLEAVPVNVIVHDGIHDAGIGQVVVHKSCKLTTLQNLLNRDRINRDEVPGVVEHANANILQVSEVDIFWHFGKWNRVPRNEVELSCQLVDDTHISSL